LEAPRISIDSEGLDLDLGDVPVESMAPGTYAADVVLPAAGTWRVWVSLRLGEFENPVALVEFPVEAPAT
jgi:copper transport protein